jgi:hypothetical protein
MRSSAFGLRAERFEVADRVAREETGTHARPAEHEPHRRLERGHVAAGGLQLLRAVGDDDGRVRRVSPSGQRLHPGVRHRVDSADVIEGTRREHGGHGRCDVAKVGHQTERGGQANRSAIHHEQVRPVHVAWREGPEPEQARCQLRSTLEGLLGGLRDGATANPRGHRDGEADALIGRAGEHGVHAGHRGCAASGVAQPAGFEVLHSTDGLLGGGSDPALQQPPPQLQAPSELGAHGAGGEGSVISVRPAA